MCHFENGPTFPLETYEQNWLQGRKIRADVIARHMPPWPAVPGYGQFVNDNSLTLREMQFMISWVEGLGPRNSGAVFTNVVDSSGKPPVAVRAKADFGLPVMLAWVVCSDNEVILILRKETGATGAPATA